MSSAAVLSWYQEIGRAGGAWVAVAEAAARADAPTALISAVAKANANFSGSSSDAMKALVEGLAVGKMPTIGLEEVRRLDTENSGYVVDVINVALAKWSL